MQTAADGAGFVPVSKETRGHAIKQRREALGIFSAREMEDATMRVDRKVPYASVLKAEKGVAADRIYDRLEAALDLLEFEMGADSAQAGSDNGSAGEDDQVEFRISGNFGVDVVVKGPVADLPELESAVARLIREMKSPE